MSEEHNGGKDVVALLTKVTQLEEEQAVAMHEQSDLARQRTETTANLVLFSSKTAEHAEKQTGMAQERTALTREQTRLSTRSAELANIRTELAQQRVFMAEDRTRMAVQRTDMARRRTSYSEWRSKLAEKRTDLARERTIHAFTRTRLSLQRTELAKERTCLALIRTGLAFLTLGVTFFRYFGVSLWTIFDVALVLFSGLMVYFGVHGYRRARTTESTLTRILSSDRIMLELLQPGKSVNQT